MNRLVYKLKYNNFIQYRSLFEIGTKINIKYLNGLLFNFINLI